MSLQQEISAAYTDGNLLVTPHPISRGVERGSDNGPMYTAEYFVMLKKLGETPWWLPMDFLCRINHCINSGILGRVPTRQPQDQTGPDDYYGVLNACKALDLQKIPRDMLKAVFRNLGALNNVNPGQWTLQSFLIRQPQLLAAMIASAYPSLKHPGHWLVRLLALPLFAYAALVIAISCINTSKENADPRRLSWHLLQTTAPVSILCHLASLVWYKRLYEYYGPAGMKAVAAIYYQGQADGTSHPFSRYWVD